MIVYGIPILSCQLSTVVRESRASLCKLPCPHFFPFISSAATRIAQGTQPDLADSLAALHDTVLYLRSSQARHFWSDKGRSSRELLNKSCSAIPKEMFYRTALYHECCFLMQAVGNTRGSISKPTVPRHWDFSRVSLWLAWGRKIMQPQHGRG